jgi:hypothetical protein
MAAKTYPRYARDEASLQNASQSAESSSTPKAFGSTRSRMVSNFTSACCTSGWPVATHRGVFTARRLVITFVLTPGRKLEQRPQVGARGRPRSEERHDTVLTATMELMQEDDLRRASIDRISGCAMALARPKLRLLGEPIWALTWGL